MLPSLREVLELPSVRSGRPVVRAGEDRLDEPVRWVHVSEISDIAALLDGGELILTTGIALPRSAAALRRYASDLAGVGVCGVVVELGRRYRTELPDALVAAARDADLPLVELHRETQFVTVTQAVHTLILDERMRELVESDERQRHRTLLTRLAIGADVPGDVGARAAALGVPLDGRSLTALAIRATEAAETPALLRDLAARAGDTLRALSVPALVGPIDDHHVVVLLAQEKAERATPVVRRVSEQVHALERRSVAPLVVAAGPTLTGPDRAATTVREAVRVSDTAAGLAPRDGWFRAADLRLHGLVHQLRDNAHIQKYVDRELGALLSRPDAAALLETLSAYCRAGGNKTDAAAALFVSRASLYDRLRKLERVLGTDLTDPDVVLGLHFAIVARATLERPDIAVRPAR